MLICLTGLTVNHQIPWIISQRVKSLDCHGVSIVDYDLMITHVLKYCADIALEALALTL